MRELRRAACTQPPAIWERYSNSAPAQPTEGTYESDVFDARIFSKWGRVESRGNGKFELYVRSGNVDNPDRNWSAWQKIDTAKELPPQAPSARYVQWKAVLFPSTPPSVLDAVTLYYLPKNVAPEVDEVVVNVGARIPAGARAVATSENSGAEPWPGDGS